MILGLVVLGPEKLPGVLRKAGRLYGEFKRVTSDAQSELRKSFDQPLKDLQSTAKTYQGFFVDAAKEVAKDPPKEAPKKIEVPKSSEPAVEPTFVPYESPPPGDEAPATRQDAVPEVTDTQSNDTPNGTSAS